MAAWLRGYNCNYFRLPEYIGVNGCGGLAIGNKSPTIVTLFSSEVVPAGHRREVYLTVNCSSRGLQLPTDDEARVSHFHASELRASYREDSSHLNGYGCVGFGHRLDKRFIMGPLGTLVAAVKASQLARSFQIIVCGRFLAWTVDKVRDGPCDEANRSVCESIGHSGAMAWVGVVQPRCSSLIVSLPGFSLGWAVALTVS